MALAEKTITSERTENDQEKSLYRAMPYNEEAEQALLGVLLTNNRSLEKVGDFLKAEHFFVGVHSKIFDAITRLVDRGQVANPVTLKNFFDKEKELEHVGGAEYLVDLAANVISIVNAYDYAKNIFEHYLRRELIGLGENMVNTAHKHDIDNNAESQIEDAESRLFRLAEFGEQKGGFVKLELSVQQALATAEKAFKAGGEVTGLTTGYVDMNKKLGGFHPSDLVIIAARPSMGKTSLVTNMAYKVASEYIKSGGERGGRVGFFSLEMSAEQLALRVLSDAGSIASEKIRRGAIDESDFLRFAEASQELAKLPLYIDDTPGLTIAALRTRARRLHRQHGLDLIIIDYMQLLSGAKRTDNRVQEISEISRGLKTLAKELDVPVIALSQLSRQVENRDNKRPQLSDLRESGSIEQDADVVMFIYREEYYLSREEPSQNANEGTEKYLERHRSWQDRLEQAMNIAEVIIGKQRHGPIGTVNLQFDGEYTRFSDLDRHHSSDH